MRVRAPLLVVLLAGVAPAAWADEPPPLPAPAVRGPTVPVPPAAPPPPDPRVRTPAAVAATAVPRPPVVCAPAPCVPCARIAVIPEWTRVVSHEEKVPAVLGDRRVAICETTIEPEYECRCVPDTEVYLEPVWVVKKVPISQKRRVPVFGEVTVPVYAAKPVPVKLPCMNFCSNEELMRTLFTREERVQVCTRREKRLLGWKEETVPCGYANERCQTGWEQRRRTCGTKEERVCVGSHPVTRRVGWRSETVVLCPETTRVIQERTVQPRRVVTVVPDGISRRPQPLGGTSIVLTESEYAAAIQEAANMSASAAAPAPAAPTPATTRPLPAPGAALPPPASSPAPLPQP